MQYKLNNDGSVSEIVKKKKKNTEVKTEQVKNTNNIKNTIKNSAVRNQGFSLSNAITDAANLYDAARNSVQNVPVLGKAANTLNTTLKTAGNFATNMGTSAIRTGENILDFANDASDAINNAASYRAIKNIQGKKKADKWLKENQKYQENFIKKNLTNEFEKATGYNKVKKDFEKGSLVTSENLGGQIAQATGGMVPALLAGQYLGLTPNLTSLQGLSGAAKAKAIIGNIGQTYLSQLPSNAILSASSYGGGLEEALNDGASRNQARLYGLANTAIEQGTEMLTGGVPGLEGKGGLDSLIEPLVNRNTNGYLNALLKAGYGAAGEGLEEYAGAMLEPLAKKIYSDEKINWDEVRKQARQAGLVGAATGAILNAPQNLQDIRDVRNENRVRRAIGDAEYAEGNNQYNPEFKGWENVRQSNKQEQLRIEQERQERNRRIQENRAVVEQTQKTKQDNINNQEISNVEPIQSIRSNQQNVTNNNIKTETKTDNLNEQEINTLNELINKKDNNTLTKDDVAELQYLRRKANNLKNPELRTNNTMDEINKSGDYKNYYTKADLDNFDETILSKAKETIQANKQGKRTKQEWLDVAKNIGLQADNMNSEQLKQYAFASFKDARPNIKDNLNRQGQKYVDFKLNEWVNAVYEGAGVGRKLENTTQQATQTETPQENIQNQQIERVEQKNNNSTNSMKDIRQEVEEKTNKTMSKHIETSSKATGTVEDIKNMDYDTIVYDATTNKRSKEQALRELEGKDTDTNVNDIHAKFRGTERLTDVDSAKITELMKQTKSLAEEAAKSGNDSEYNKRMEQFRTLKGDYAVALSESGQFVQYAKVIKELDPDTQVDVLKKVIEREQRRGNKKYEDVALNEKLVEEYKKAKTDEERDAIMEEIKDDTARQIKITFADKANEFRFLSMLGNVKTHGRNIVGNFGMYSLQSFKDGVAAIGEDIYNKTSKDGLEVRSKTLKPATKEVSKFVSDKVDSFMKDQKNKYNDSRGIKGDLEGRTKKFNDNNIIGKALNKASDINSKALDFEDKFFSSLMTKQAMKGFLTANGIETNADIEAHPELVAQALDYALFKGKEATFHQDSTTATAIRNLRDKLYTGSGYSKLGGLAMDATLPFVSTPANIAKTALEYTPIVGFGNINKQFQNAPNSMKANVLIDSLSKQFAGGALMAVGAYLASQGLVKGSGDDDKEDKTEASLGNAGYSVKIGNSTYDLSWLSPTAIPFFEGVEVFNAFKKANSKGGIKATDTADLIDTMFGTLNPMTDMSVLQSIERIITSIAYGGNAVKSATSTAFSSYLQQYIPTLLSQIAQVRDTKQRNTNTGGNVLEKTWDQIKYKIPASTEFTGAGKWLNKNLTRKSLPEKVDVWGNTNKTADNIPQRAFEALVSPANRKDYKVDKTTKELERLARETDDTAMLPTVKNKSLRVNGKDYDLKGKDYVNLQKDYGKTAKKNLDKLIKSDAYKNADDTEKQSMVRKLYDYASYKAKEKYAKNKGINFDSGNQTSFAMIDAFDIPYEKYVENKVSGNESASKILDKLNGAGLSEAQKGAVMNYYNRAYYVNEDELYNTLENSDLSDKQKELIKAKYEKNITDSERERYQRADNIGVDYDLYTKFRSFVTSAKGESRSGGLSKKQKIINWIQEQELTAQQKYNLYNDYINNQGIFSYYK